MPELFYSDYNCQIFTEPASVSRFVSIKLHQISTMTLAPSGGDRSLLFHKYLSTQHQSWNWNLNPILKTKIQRKLRWILLRSKILTNQRDQVTILRLADWSDFSIA